jgi:hypothetical protein
MKGDYGKSPLQDDSLSYNKNIFNLVMVQRLNKIPKIVIEYIGHQLFNFLLEK